MIRKHHGFTLIELMVVIVIIAIMTSVAMISLNPNDSPHEKEARRLALVLQQASMEAISQFKQIGVVFNEDGYSFAALNEETQQWATYTSETNRAFKEHELPEDVSIEIEVDGIAESIMGDSDIEELELISDEDLEKVDTGTEEEKEVIPQIYFLSSGEASKFSVFLMQDDKESYYIIEGEMTGSIKLRGDDDE